ncbi:MAG: mechanosensitive ion channel domain-containing protein [Fuerstiella sp.]
MRARALTAVIMLVFKDAILGFVASVQIVAHNMVEVGDWIEMRGHGVDGDVSSISLTTIKVQNFDKTVSCIPTYGILSDSCKNWRGMQEAGGRRIKRWIYIDMNSIKPLDYEMADRLGKIALLKDYLVEKRSHLKTIFCRAM